VDALTGPGRYLVACQTCIGFFEIEKIVIGRIVDMTDIVSILTKSDTVITP
jgi:hypothetical protein